MLDEQSPGLEWDDEPYEFGLPIGTDGTSEPQLLGSGVRYRKPHQTLQGARPITYEIIATTRPGVQINATTGSLLYVGSAVGVGDDDIRGDCCCVCGAVREKVRDFNQNCSGR